MASSPAETSEETKPAENLQPPGLLPLPNEPKPALSTLAESKQAGPSDLPPDTNEDPLEPNEPSPPETPEAPRMDAPQKTDLLHPETPPRLAKTEPEPTAPETSPSPSLRQPAENPKQAGLEKQTASEHQGDSPHQAVSENQPPVNPIHFARVELRLLPSGNSDKEALAKMGFPTASAKPAGADSRSASASASEPERSISVLNEPTLPEDVTLPEPPEIPSPEPPQSVSHGEKAPSATEQKTPAKATPTPPAENTVSNASDTLSPKVSDKTPPEAQHPLLENLGLPGEDLRPPVRTPCWCQAAREAHQTLFFDNNFDYLNAPCYEGAFLGDSLKRVQMTPWATLDIGGEYRLRHHSERNHRGGGLTGADDDFLLHRTRIYANLELGELARIYAEMNDALSTNETYQPRPTEEDRTELENLFIDVPLLGFRNDGLAARLGRQELLYGAGRLVSPLDWANTRRTFEGYKLFWQGPLWTVDAFWTRPIYPNPDAFDGPDQSQQFMGLYLVRRLGCQAVLEGYYLRLVEEDVEPRDFDFHTLGLRSRQEYNGWLGELEAAVQFGSYGDLDHTAGMYTIGVGRRFQCLPGKPVFWMYYDWASGDRTLGNGFHHLLPDSHQYLGYMDLFGRRNIEDWSFHFLVYPARDWTVRFAWHIFHRQNPLDVPYGVDMTPLVGAPGGSGDYGQELDLVLQWTIRPRAELSFGYSRFFAGDFFRTNPSPAPYQDDADFFYTQFSLRF